MYLLGIEGSETKTHCIIGDEEGNICAEGFGGAANYHIVGLQTAQTSIETAISRALGKLNIKITDIQYAVVGLAGADCEEDFTKLYKMGSKIFGKVPFQMVNNCWLALRLGSKENWGIISICDMGHGVMGKTKEGNKAELRNMTYVLGNRGGGADIAYMALHYAFRADEGVEQKTKLQQGLPKIFEVQTMADVDALIREEGLAKEYRIGVDKLQQILMLVSLLAREGDYIAQEIMIAIGHAVGKSAASIVRRLKLEGTDLPVVLGGSIFIEENPLFLDAYKMELHRVVPEARFVLIDKKLVVGAYYLAVDYIKQNLI